MRPQPQPSPEGRLWLSFWLDRVFGLLRGGPNRSRCCLARRRCASCGPSTASATARNARPRVILLGGPPEIMGDGAGALCRLHGGLPGPAAALHPRPLPLDYRRADPLVPSLTQTPHRTYRCGQGPQLRGHVALLPSRDTRSLDVESHYRPRTLATRRQRKKPMVRRPRCPLCLACTLRVSRPTPSPIAVNCCPGPCNDGHLAFRRWDAAWMRSATR